jgi:hypothetical protein
MIRRYMIQTAITENYCDDCDKEYTARAGYRQHVRHIHGDYENNVRNRDNFDDDMDAMEARGEGDYEIRVW